jgi:hypothetical protein
MALSLKQSSRCQRFSTTNNGGSDLTALDRGSHFIDQSLRFIPAGSGIDRLRVGQRQVLQD